MRLHTAGNVEFLVFPSAIHHLLASPAERCDCWGQEHVIHKTNSSLWTFTFFLHLNRLEVSLLIIKGKVNYIVL